jgi:recombination protein RecA
MIKMDDDIIEIVKKHGLGAYAGDDEKLQVKFIKTGMPAFDSILGGGIARNRVSELVGDTAAGKTFIAQRITGQAIKKELSVVWFNAENKYDPKWFKATGVDTGKLLVVQGNIGEDIWESIIEIINEGTVDLVVVDSLAAMMPKIIDEATMDRVNTLAGKQAFMNARGMQKVANAMSDVNRATGTALLFMNQIRANIRIGPSYGAAESSSPGGHAYDHEVSVRVRVRRGEWDQETKSDVTSRNGFNIVLRTEKNQVYRPWMECSIPFKFTGHVDMVASVVLLAQDLGVIKNTGAKYFFKQAQIAYGWNKCLEYFRENKKHYAVLRKAIDNSKG